jgi:hypothetical protein
MEYRSGDELKESLVTIIQRKAKRVPNECVYFNMDLTLRAR